MRRHILSLLLRTLDGIARLGSALAGITASAYQRTRQRLINALLKP